MRTSKWILLGIAVIALIVSITHLSSALVTPDLKVYFTFNATAGEETNQISRTSNLTYISTTVTRRLDGIRNYSYNFTGLTGSYVNGTNMTNFNSSVGTLSMWLNWSAVGEDTDGYAIPFGMENVATPASSFFYIQITNSTGADATGNFIKIQEKVGGTIAYTFNTTAGSLKNLTKNQWVHFAVVQNGTKLQVYLNGTRVTGDYSSATTEANKAFWFRNLINTGTNPVDSFYVGALKGQGVYYGGMIDEVGYWDRVLSDSDISFLYNNGQGNFYPFSETAITLTPQTIFNKFNATISFPDTMNITNATLWIYNPSNSIYDNSHTNLITGVFNSTTFTLTPMVDNYKWNVYACGANSSGTLCYFAPANLSTSGFVENSQSYNTLTTSSNLEYFGINITYNSDFYNSITSRLVYNITSYLGSSLGTGDNGIFNASLSVPTTSAVVNNSFYWAFTMTNSSGSIFYYNSTLKNQTVTSVFLDNCTTYGNPIFNFTLYDEDNLQQINGTIEVAINLYVPSTKTFVSSYNTTFPFTALTGNARVCISNLNSTYSVYYTTKYYNTTLGAIEYKAAQNLILTNTSGTQQVKLYDLLLSRATPYIISMQGVDLTNLDNVVIDVQRQYLPLNQFISVESPITDNNGRAVVQLVSTEVIYNFIVSKDGQMIATFNNQYAKCTNVLSGDCYINLNIALATTTAQDYTKFGNASTVFLFDKLNRILYFTYNSLDGQVHQVNVTTLLNDAYGNNTICTSTGSGISGTYSCVIPTSYGNSSIYSTISIDGVFVGRNFFSFGETADQIFGGTKVVLGMLMYTTITLLMISTPVTIILGSVLGIVFMVFFHVVDGGTLSGNFLVVLWFIIAGGVIVFQITKRR